jgi:superfamily II DNA/RNA helicase
MQVGAPTSREQYVHRLGRTGRAGKEGRGVLLLCPFERFFLDKVSAIPGALTIRQSIDWVDDV